MNESVFSCEVCNLTPHKGAPLDDLPYKLVRTLYDSSHSSFELYECGKCKQIYLGQFHEIIDWNNGNDDIWMRWMPLAADEVERLNLLVPSGVGNGSIWNQLYEFMKLRRRLVCDHRGEYHWADFPDPGDMMPPG